MTPRTHFARWPLVVATLAGGCTMAVEIAAVRLLSPWFGTSLVVWTNVLEVILLGLSLGYLVGARLSRGKRPGARLALVLLVGALFAAWTPLLAGPVCDGFLPEGLALHDAAPLLTWGSLAAGLLLFLPAATILGMVGPLLVEEIGRSGEAHAGSAGGRVLAASTLGSVVGAFGTSYFALSNPALGVSRTFVLVGVVLLVCSVWTAVAVRAAGRRAATGIGALLLLPAPWVSALRTPELADGLSLLDAVDTPYQTVRVVEDDRFDVRYRYLQVNEGFDSFQSVWTPQPGLLGEGFYYDDFALPLLWSGGSGEWSVLVLGFGAGTVHRVLEGVAPEGVRLVMTGIEIDEAVVQLGERWLGLDEDDADLTVDAGIDARFALRATDRRFDQIVLDAYANQVEIPPHLSTVEYFTAVRDHLVEGGWVVANVGGFGFDDPVVLAIGETLAAAFGHEVLVLRVPSARNFTLIARRDASPPMPGEPGWRFAGSEAELAERLLDPRELPGGWAQIAPPERAPLTDDDNPIERLQLRSLLEGRERLHAGS